MRGILAVEWAFDIKTFRLNNRDALRERSAHEHSNSAVNLSIEGGGRSYKYRSGPTAVAVSVHQTITSDFEMRKHDYDDAPELETSVRLLYTAVVDKY